MPDPAGQDGDAAVDGHEGGGHQFKFITSLRHHLLPGPAMEPVHGHPVLIFDLADYATANLDELRRAHPAAFARAEGAAYRQWATATAGSQDPVALAKGMEVAADVAWLGAMPRSLSWLNQQTFFGSVALVFTFLIIGVFARRRRGELRPRSVSQHVIEAIVLFVRDDICRANIRHRADGLVPHFTGLFLAILSFNIMGLVPGAGTASGNPGVNLAFAAATLAAMLILGMRTQGVTGFWKHLCPVEWSWNPLDMVIYLILLMIELMGLIIKPVALTVRLFANMFGGHTVLLGFLALGPLLVAKGAADAISVPLGIFGVLVSIALMALELLVAFLQAYVFTLLSAVFVGTAMYPEH